MTAGVEAAPFLLSVVFLTIHDEHDPRSSEAQESRRDLLESIKPFLECRSPGEEESGRGEPKSEEEWLEDACSTLARWRFGEGRRNDVEIELELPQYKIDELLAQLQDHVVNHDQDSSLKSEFPLAHVATVAALAPVRASVRGALGDSTALRVADEWDPLAKLAQFKELQARYAAVKEQRERAESTKRILQQMPTAGATPPPAPAMATGVADPQITPPEFPPAGGLPFPFCGVPGVLSPRTKAPPEPERDLTDGAYVYDAVREIAREEGPEVYTRMSKEEVLLAKDGMDMTLNHLRTTGARMRTEVRELDRKMEEAGQMAQIRQMASNEPELQDELMAQQRLIHEQQRLADEERAFWLRREKVLQPEEVDDFHLEGGHVSFHSPRGRGAFRL
ncbi:unnamed protein product [Durusdinium trenchii]|uniref:Uncharacterized protein n=1 Tax=Durusdinium trenchii TaxID=1381693 RepID=A0ABP0J069_9DINO